MFHLMIIVLVVSIYEIQALPCGYPDSLAVNRYYSGNISNVEISVLRDFVMWDITIGVDSCIFIIVPTNIDRKLS